MIRLIFILFLFVFSAIAGNRAVVIIDMQYGFYTRGNALQTQELKDLVLRQQQLLTWAKKEKLPVVFFEYDGYQETDYALTSTLWGKPFKTITKFDDNAFTGPSKDEANEYFDSLDIDTLIIAGINASGCVKRTTIGALAEGYKVITAADLQADLYQYPPIYPQDNWFFEHDLLETFDQLDWF